jgi:hypothetical protein
MFLRFGQKMRQALTFLATIENDHHGHENTGRYFDSGAAHDFRSGLYRSTLDQQSADGATGELKTAFGIFVGGDNDAFGRSVPEID